MQLIDAYIPPRALLSESCVWDCFSCDRLSYTAYAVLRVMRFSNVETARLFYFSYFHSLPTALWHTDLGQSSRCRDFLSLSLSHPFIPRFEFASHPYLTIRMWRKLCKNKLFFRFAYHPVRKSDALVIILFSYVPTTTPTMEPVKLAYVPTFWKIFEIMDDINIWRAGVNPRILPYLTISFHFWKWIAVPPTDEKIYSYYMTFFLSFKLRNPIGDYDAQVNPDLASWAELLYYYQEKFWLKI